MEIECGFPRFAYIVSGENSPHWCVTWLLGVGVALVTGDIAFVLEESSNVRRDLDLLGSWLRSGGMSHSDGHNSLHRRARDESGGECRQRHL